MGVAAHDGRPKMLLARLRRLEGAEVSPRFVDRSEFPENRENNSEPKKLW